MKKLILAIVAGYVWLISTGFVIHGHWLKSDYDQVPQTWRPLPDMHQKMWILLFGQLLFTAMFVYIYTRGAEKKPWMGQGVRYGILMTFFTVIPYSLSEYVVYRVPHLLAVKWMVVGAVQLTVMGLLVAAICKDAAA